MNVPEQYSAHLVAGTTNRDLSVCIPLSGGKISGKHIDANLGSGGAIMQFMTTNGGVGLITTALDMRESDLSGTADTGISRHLLCYAAIQSQVPVPFDLACSKPISSKDGRWYASTDDDVPL